MSAQGPNSPNVLVKTCPDRTGKVTPKSFAPPPVAQCPEAGTTRQSLTLQAAYWRQSAETLEVHRYWHTVWNLSALILINGCNFLWLHRTLTRGVNYWSDLLCDVAMATYQL